MAIDQKAEAESLPAMEVHLGETHVAKKPGGSSHGDWARHCIIWMNGKRWEGTLFWEEEATRG